MKQKIVVLTGAGMSAESGLKTYRDSDGLWNNYPVEQVASIQGYLRDRSLVLDFYNKRRDEYARCEPNQGHRLLSEMQEEYDIHIITQNVDDLHERAGSHNIIHLHGEIMKKCPEDRVDKAYPMKVGEQIHLGDTDARGVQMRPFIVWFGEAVPMMGPATEIVQKADILLIIGTSLAVYPAAGLLYYAPSNCPIYLVDPKDVSTSRKVTHIKKGAGEGVKEFFQRIKS